MQKIQQIEITVKVEKEDRLKELLTSYGLQWIRHHRAITFVTFVVMGSVLQLCKITERCGSAQLEIMID